MNTQATTGKASGKLRPFCVRCERRVKFADQPRLRRIHHQWQLTGVCSHCGTPVHSFVRNEGEAISQKTRSDVRHTVKISGDTKEALQVASLSMKWSQSEVVEYLLREHLLELMNRVTRGGQGNPTPCSEGLLRFLVSMDVEREGDSDENVSEAECEDRDEREDVEDDAGKDSDSDEDVNILNRFWRWFRPE